MGFFRRSGLSAAVAILSFSVALALCIHIGGSMLSGLHENADTQCDRRVAPPQGVVESEANAPRGEVSFWPLGISCTWQGAEGKPETVPMFGWTLTAEAASVVLLCAVGAAAVATRNGGPDTAP